MRRLLTRYGAVGLFVGLLFVVLAACGSGGVNAPANITATPGAASITVTWEDASEDEDGFVVYRKSAASDTDFERLAETEADVTSYTDDTVELEQRYLYEVTAVLGTQESRPTATSEPVAPKSATMPLSVTWQGAGGGRITSEPPGVDCAPTQGECTFELTTDETFTLTVMPDATSDFGGWGGDCAAAGTEPCSLTMDTPKQVQITLNQAERTLTLLKAGDGAGTVTSSNVAGLTCDVGCDEEAASFIIGTSVGLEAEAAAGSVFRGWEGACDGTENCTVQLDENKSVTARFEKVAPPVINSFSADPDNILRGRSTVLSWQVEDNPETTLRLNPGDQNVTGETQVSVTPTETTTYELVASNTSGEDSQATEVTVESAFTLDVIVQGSSGKVESNPVGIDCSVNDSSGCDAIYRQGTEVTLTAFDGTFREWKGCPSSTGNTCTVILNQAEAIIAEFE